MQPAATRAPSCAPRSKTRTTATTSSTIRRLPTRSTTRCCASCSSSRPRIPSCAPPIRRRSASARAPSERFAPYAHARPMLSLANAFDDDELRAFDERVRKLAGAESTLRLRAEDRRARDRARLRRRRARARRHARRRPRRRRRHAEPAHGPTIPLRLRGAGPAVSIEVRGEVYLRKSDFEKLNAKRERDGLAGLRQPAQRRVGRRAPARSAPDRGAPALVLCLCDRRHAGRTPPRTQIEVARAPARVRLSTSTRTSARARRSTT